jgi:sugar phosphate isomerase/epimerase
MKISRRALLGAAALSPAVAAYPFRLAICNETFQGMSLADACHAAIQTGYTGVEIAPFTLAEDPAAIPATRRREMRERIAETGLTYIGLHSLLSAPKGLHVTTADKSVRDRSWDYCRRLIDLCFDLGRNGVLVFGSGRQRSAEAGASVADAARRFEDGLARMAPLAVERGVVILVEALAPHLANVVTSLEQAVAMVKRIDSPGVRTMFDTHNAAAETVPHAELIRLYHPYIRHVHVNELDGRYPGTGSYDFKSVFSALAECSYQGWVSLEVFDFRPDGLTIARDSARYLRTAMTSQ